MAASTIQECSELIAIERRERRKQRILEQKEKRISVNDSPQYECINGTCSLLEDQDIVSIVKETPSKLESSLHTCKTEDASKSGSAETLNFSTGQDEEDKITYVSPKYADYVEKKRLQAAIGFGALLAILSLVFGDFRKFVIPVILLVTFYETFLSKKTVYPKHGYVVNTILAAGFHEDNVIFLGMFIDASWEVGIDLALIALGFLSTASIISIFI